MRRQCLSTREVMPMDLLILLVRLATALLELAGKVLKLIDARKESRDDNGEPRAGPKLPVI